MRTKNFWLAVTVKENGKHYSYVVKAPQNDNLVSIFEKIPNLQTANIYTSKKKAGEVVQFWNDCYRKNGTYMFDEPGF